MAGPQRRIAPIAVTIAAIGAGLLLHLGGGVNAAETREVAIDNYSFSPGDLIVPAGTTVTWINHDETPHTVVAPPAIPAPSDPAASTPTTNSPSPSPSPASTAISARCIPT